MIFGILFCTTVFAHTIEWYVGDNLLSTTTCESGDNITPPTVPEKFGYHFKEWESGYTPIEYLESTGTQYIDTGVKIQGTNTDISIIMSVVSIASNKGDVPFFFGSGSPWVASFAIKPPRYQYNLYNNGYYGPNYTLSEKHSYRFVLGPNYAQYYIDDVLYQTHNNIVAVDVSHNVVLFARNYLEEIGYFSYMKLYGFSISMNDILVRDFIPALDHNGIPGMYDKVEKKFYYNQGTGQFIAGPAI